jgi:hypothetical protein
VGEEIHTVIEISNFLMSGFRERFAAKLSVFWKQLAAKFKKAFDIHARRNKAEHDLSLARDRIVELEDLLAINNDDDTTDLITWNSENPHLGIITRYDDDTTDLITWNSENPHRGIITRYDDEAEDSTPKNKEQQESRGTH